ncbi:glycosyltransferase family 2 protein [Bacillus sp. 179-C3.3 HS]|uniref:glycosyltransferase family 2 protein n=1 Tax=Bacillus sp. 179-C3.3 HS TaxID=3232162 RepID=UPI00399EF942
MPVYNAGTYLNEAIDSILGQSLNFEENVEIILIDNNSDDNSLEICNYYMKKYPKNIKVRHIDKPNVSIARNVGIKECSKSSSFIGFIDSDDKISKSTLREVYRFFESNLKVNISVLPIYYFDSRKGSHSLNYRFEEKTNVVNIFEKFNFVHYHIGGVFFRRCILDDKNFGFNPNLSFWEDALLINQILIQEKEYGLVHEGKYFYRKRKSNNSLVDITWYKKDRYTNLLQEGYLKLIKISIDEFGYVIDYIQYLIIYHMKLYFFKKYNSIIYEVLDDLERKEFFEKLCEVLQYIDEKIIFEQNFKLYIKEYLITLKRKGVHFDKIIKLGEVTEEKVIIVKWKLKRGFFEIFGILSGEHYSMNDNDHICIISRNKNLKVVYEEDLKDLKIWDKVVRKRHNSLIKAKIPLHAMKFSFVLASNGKSIYMNEVNLITKLLDKILGRIIFLKK